MTHIDEFSYHEVLDRASIIADMFEKQILQHDAVSKECKMKVEAEKICGLLHNFYQRWGSIRHEF